jgi:hypothetical protein
LCTAGKFNARVGKVTKQSIRKQEEEEEEEEEDKCRRDFSSYVYG